MSTLRRQARPSPSWDGGAEGPGVGRIVDQGDERRGHRLADAAGEERATLDDRLARRGRRR